MGHSLNEAAARVASALVVLAVVALISADTKTALALGAFCVVGYVLVYGYRTADFLTPARNRVTPHVRRGIGVMVTVGVIVAVADRFDEALWLASMSALGYIGHRTGGVLRGALHGAVIGVAGGVALVIAASGIVVAAGILGVAGARDALLKVLFSPAVVGFVTVIWAAYVVVLSALTGLVSGGLGGAIARLY